MRRGFTLIELLVVIVIIGLLAGRGIASFGGALNKSKTGVAISTATEMKQAVKRYYLDNGFYPPDVGRGMDPGFMQALPTNPDTGVAISPLPPCAHCPANWNTTITSTWGGPYLDSYPNTPYGGEYDYNYWPPRAAGPYDRYGCLVDFGVYVGIQGDAANANTIPPSEEQKLIDADWDADNCINGESQMLLVLL